MKATCIFGEEGETIREKKGAKLKVYILKPSHAGSTMGCLL